MDRNDRRFRAIQHTKMSLSARRAWIEINVLSQPSKPRRVALRKESVDRNDIRIATIDSVIDVALRKESVDRNPAPKYHRILLPRSLSARRAWIEISRLGG